jgi:hypothetical protein
VRASRGDGLRFARLRTRALDGTDRLLPDELPAERTLLLLAYRQRHQRDVDAWIALAVRLGVPATPRSAVVPMATAVLEVPFLRAAWLPARAFIDGGMARGIADPDVLARTLTAYGAPGAHRRATGLAHPLTRSRRPEVEALVVGRDGRVFWHASGPPSARADGVVTSLRAALQLAEGPDARPDAQR